MEKRKSWKRNHYAPHSYKLEENYKEKHLCGAGEDTKTTLWNKNHWSKWFIVVVEEITEQLGLARTRLPVFTNKFITVFHPKKKRSLYEIRAGSLIYLRPFRDQFTPNQKALTQLESRSQNIAPSTAQKTRKNPTKSPNNHMAQFVPKRRELTEFSSQHLRFEKTVLGCWDWKLLSCFAENLALIRDSSARPHDPKAYDYQSTWRLIAFICPTRSVTEQGNIWRAGAPHLTLIA